MSLGLSLCYAPPHTEAQIRPLSVFMLIDWECPESRQAPPVTLCGCLATPWLGLPDRWHLRPATSNNKGHSLRGKSEHPK
jgi:hypothetical protein